ncbi:hypothetical protein HPB47_005372, partial [Ixodes persulcatus]
SGYVFLRVDSVRCSLQPTYTGPHPVVTRGEETFTLQVNVRDTVVSVDRLKPAFVESETIAQPADLPRVQATSSSTVAPATRIEPSRTVRF